VAERGRAIRPDAKVVLGENRLTVKQEARGRLPVEAVENVVEHAHQSNAKGGLGEIPLPIPMRMEDQVKDEGHSESKRITRRTRCTARGAAGCRAGGTERRG